MPYSKGEMKGDWGLYFFIFKSPEFPKTNIERARETNVEALIGQPRSIRNKAFAAMNVLEELFDTTNGLLNNKLNKLMIRFKFTHTEFYSEYQRARTIVD